ncbi:terpene synthase family protein [Streptomyces sp. NPDC054765]
MGKSTVQPRLESLAQLRHSLTQGEGATESPHYEEVRNSDFYPGIFARGRFPQSEEPRIIAADYVLCAALCWPACGREALWDFSAISLVFVERDDVIDADGDSDVRGMLKACIADAESAFTTTNEERFGPLMKVIWDRLRGYVPPGQLDRLTRTVLDYFHGCVETAERRTAAETYEDLDAYLEARRRTIGQAIDHILIEISLGIDLSAECENPLLQSLHTCDIDRVILLQDLQSLHKEILAGEGEENAVSVIARSRNITTMEAAQLTIERFETTMDRHAELSAQLIKETGSSSISRYVNGMNRFVAGLISWNARSPRYGGHSA